jgi:hypothetical protein
LPILFGRNKPVKKYEMTLSIEQLKHIAEHLPLNISKFCKKYGVSPQSVAHYIDGTRGGKRGISPANQKKIVKGIRLYIRDLEKIVGMD